MKKKSMKSDGQLRDAYLNFSETFSELFQDAGKDFLSAQPIDSKISGILSGRVPVPVSYDDGDQSPLKGMKSQNLRTQWASGLDYSPYNPQFHYLSDWMKVIFSGDYQGFLKLIDGKTEEEVKKMISRRETLCNVSAIFHVIKGARTLGCGDPSFFSVQEMSRRNLNVKMEHMKILIKLLTLGCDINVKDFAGFTPLHHCCTMYGNDVTLKMAERLIRAGANVNAKNRFGSTALQEVTMSYKYDFIKLLLENGADPYLKDNDGVSTLVMSRHNPIMKELIGKSYRNNMREEKKESPKDHRNCGGCGKNDDGNKKCTGCFFVFYCSSKCQTNNWTQHKNKCKEIQEEYMVCRLETNQYIIGIDSKGKEFKRPPGTWSKKSHFVVKIQIPLSGGMDMMLIYNKDKSFQVHLKRKTNEKAYDELDAIIKSEGFKGIKGYFHAILSDESPKTVKINTKRVLPPQPW